MVLPFFFQTKLGLLPPLVTEAVNVIELPAQTLLEDAVTETSGMVLELMPMVIAFEVEVFCERQAAFDVTIQEIRSLLLRLEDANVAALLPMLLPFTFH